MAVTQIRGLQIRDREITTAKLALTSVIEEILGDSAVTNLKVANDAISTAKIIDLNVTTEKLAEGAITAAKVGVGAITGGAQFAASVSVDGKTFTGAAAFSSPLTVADATVAGHAINKSQLDTAIATVNSSVAALGNAFNYVGLVEGGADAASANDMALAAEKDPGDYYKVTASGYFKVGEVQAAFFANAGDGLLFNTSGELDKIDNTNSTVQGTVDEVDVTGAPDTGFTVALSQTIRDQQARHDAVYAQPFAVLDFFRSEYALSVMSGYEAYEPYRFFNRTTGTVWQFEGDGSDTRHDTGELLVAPGTSRVVYSLLDRHYEIISRTPLGVVSYTPIFPDWTQIPAVGGKSIKDTVGFLSYLNTTDKDSITDAINEVLTKVGQPALLTTTSKTSAVSAINELDADIGTLSALTTTTKTSLVAAINELDAKSVEDIYVREAPAGDVDGLNAAFALSATPINATVQVYVNGLLQEPTDDYTISGTTVTFGAAPLVGDKIRAIYFKPSA